ncbi:nitric oxide synthase-interacting protein, partial [Austrofundulus limnaeus]
MTRHGKNCTAGAVYTYHEKKKDTAASGYGTQSVRLGKDAIKDFDCCCLSLQPCQDPVVTPHGYLYEKQAILEYILHQKTEIAKKMKAYEKQKQALKTNNQL